MARNSDKSAHWAEVIRRYRHSGLTQAQFCRENVLSYHSFRWWLHQPGTKRAMGALRAATGKARGKPQTPARSEIDRFLPVRIVEAADSGSDRSIAGSTFPIQVLLGGGRRVAVGPGFDPDVLRRVVAALELPGC